MFERVAITGVGMITALGRDAGTTFGALLSGVRGFRPLTLFEPTDARTKIAAEVPDLALAAIAPAGTVDDWSRTDALAVIAAREAFREARATPSRLGVCLGGTTGGMLETERGLLKGPLDRIDPERAARLLSHPLDLTTARVAAALGGAARTATLCAACSSGALAIVTGAAWLAEGGVDLVVAGGADALCRLTFFGFDALGALDPEPCRPFDTGRRGLGLGEGAAFLCLEREAAARFRGARILAFLSGAATGAEAHHITHPEPSGERAAALVTRALSVAGLAARELDYVNAHGTGTEHNDAMEARALALALGAETARVRVSSSKAQIGHTLGAAGAVEAAITVLALSHQKAPPTVGLVEPVEPKLRHVVGSAESAALRAAASCSFGFGGTGAVLVFERATDTPRALSAVTSERLDRDALVVTGLAAVGPFGAVSGLGAARSIAASRLEPSGPLAVEPASRLDPERSRRFDRSAALVTYLTERALADAGLDGAEVGLAAGTAFGSVERSVHFVLRAAERGVRRANPAEFPHLVASAASGNASIYARTTGPAFGVSAAAASAESAVDVAAAFLRLGEGRAFVAGAAEGFDPIVAEVLGPLATSEGLVPRAEGGGFLVLEREVSARARGAVARARLVGVWAVGAGDAWPSSAPRRSDRALLVVTTLTSAAESLLLRSAWRDCPRRSLLTSTGFHEAVSGVALAVAASAVAAGEADEALVVNGTGGLIWLTHFENAEAGR